MITPLIGLVVGLGVAFGLAAAWPGHPVWTTLAGILGFIGGMVPINLFMRKRIQAVFDDVQKHVEASQEKLRRKINVMQQKNMSGGKGLQRRMEKEQAAGIREAIQILDRIDPLCKWAPLARRQTNTLRGQLCFQIKDFEQADQCFEKCLLMDPVILAMKMARLYKQERLEELEKAFKKGVKRFKDEKATLLYALYSFVLVKAGRIDEALALLDKGKESTENEVIRQNWEHLANGRVKHFSNAGLGDQWYALHLEMPKPVKVRQRFGGGRRMR